MKTNLKFPNIPCSRREPFVTQRCSYLCDNEVHKAVIEGRFVLAWDGEIDSERQTPAFGVLESVTMNNDGSRTYSITSEFGNEHIKFQNANVLREEWCPDVAVVDKFGSYHVHKWVGLVERDGKVLANITDCGNPCRAVDPSELILLDDCKVGLHNREEATNV